VGTIATIIRMLRMPDGSTTAIIQGKKRFEIIEMVKTDPYFTAKVKEFEEMRPAKGDKSFEALVSSLKDLAMDIIKASPHIPTRPVRHQEHRQPSFLVNFISSNMNAEVAEKQKMLEVADLRERARTPAGAPDQGAADAGDEERDPEQGAHRGGPPAARVLPAPADEDHPGRARRQSHRTGDRGDAR
jgi:ATP-dependent Lon protease